MTQLYTPFMAQAGKTIGAAMTKRTQNRLYSDAYMGKPGAMEQLMQVSPQMANQLQQQNQQSEQLKLQQAATKQKRGEEVIRQNTPLLKAEAEAVANFDNTVDANKYRVRRLGELKQTNPELAALIGDNPITQDHLEQLWTVYRDKPESEKPMTKYQEQSLEMKEKQLDKETSNIQDEKYYQELKKTDPERAKRFGQDVGLVSKEGRELSGHNQKNLTKYSDAAVTAQNMGGKFEYLASEFERLDPAAGVAGTAHNFLKEITGSQDAVSEIRTEYMKLRASQLVKNLPPGAASEKDVQLALSGFPSPDANSKHMASFLRGLSKLQAFDEKFNTFKAEFLSEKGHERGMLKAWKEQQPVDIGKATKTATSATGEKLYLINNEWVKADG